MTSRWYGTDLNPFIGRERELATLTAFVEAGESRLLTILGPGGAGKTRLVRTFLQTVQDHAPLFCDLSEARTVESLVAAVCATLSLTSNARTIEELISRVGHALAQEDTVLVLDNFEQLTNHAGVVERWLGDAPGARIVVTSRERLDIAGEEILELSSLDPRDALSLFEKRTRSVRPGWSIEDQNRETVAAICEHLDGMPLAIELAAARMEILSAPELLSRMHQRFQLLRSGRSGATKRHASLRAAIDWSWDLLSEAERAALRQLAVFHGGFSLAAAEAVLLDAPVIDLVQALRKASLLRVQERIGEELRFVLYESVREYALERLQSAAERSRIEARHTAWCVREVEHWAAQQFGPHSPARHRRIERELENVLASIQRSLSDDPESAARLILAVHETLAARGRHALLAELFERGLDAGRRAGSEHVLARLLIAHLGELVTRQGRSDVDEELAQAEELARQCGDVALLARFFQIASAVAGRGGSAARSKELLEEALKASVASNDRALEAMSRRLLFVREYESGHFDAARSHLEQALAICRRIDYRELLGRVLYNLGIIESIQGRKDFARTYAQQCLETQSSLGNELGESDALNLLGTLALDAAREEEARRYFLQALEKLRRTGDRINEAVALRWLGDVELSDGNLTAAEHLYRSSVLVHREASEPRMEGYVLVQLGLVACERRAFVDALDWLQQAERIFLHVDEPMGLGVVHCYRGAVFAGQGERERSAQAVAQGRTLLESVGVRQMLPLADAFEGLHEVATGHLDAARARLARLESGPREAHSYLVRVAVRHLRTALQETPAGASPPTPAFQSLTIALTKDGRACRFNANPVVDLTRRRSLRLLLVRLCEQLRLAPDQALTLDELFAAGWPGERALPEAAARRVYVAISTLRSLGLGHALVTRDDGYLLHPQTVLQELPR